MARSQDRIEQTTSSEIQPPDRTCLLIAGMHRSGTSALARVLSLLGADLPRTLMEGAEANNVSNATGHWESEAMARFGDMVLDSAGTDWRSPEPVVASWYRSPRYREMRERAVELLQEEFGHSPLFVFKDPRVCKLMPFWLDVLDDFGVSPRVISILRSPLEVASSLHARNGFDLSIGQLLWLRYVLDAETGSRSASRVFVTYDRLLENAGEVTARIGSALDLVWPRASLKTDGAIAGFLSVSHRHHERELDRTTGSQRGLTPLLADVYAILTRWALEGEAAGDRPMLDRSREELDRALSLLGEPVALALHQGSQLRRFKSHDKERDALFKTVEERARVSDEKARAAEIRAQGVQKAEAEAAAARREGDKRQAALEEARRQIRTLETVRDKAVEECQGGRITQARLEERLVAAEAARAAAISSCERIEAKLEEFRKDREALLAQVHAARLDQVRSEAKSAALERELRSLEGVARELEQTRVKLHQLERDYVREAGVASENARKFEARTTQLEALRVEHGRTIEAGKAAGARLEEVRRENAAIGKKLAEQQRIADERQAAILHLREDRARKVAERDERNRKLEMQIESLQGQLPIVQSGDHVSGAHAPLAKRVGRWLRLPGALAAGRRAERLEQLRGAELFDGWWYLAKYEDVKVQGQDPAEHYLDHGGAEGRSPGPNFDGGWYLETNPDVREAGINPLLHYLEHGRGEGREIRSLAIAKQQRMFADASRGGGRATGGSLRSHQSSTPRAIHSGVPRDALREEGVSNGSTAATELHTSIAINPEEIEECGWAARGLSFSTLSAFADLNRDLALMTGAGDAPVLVGDVQVAHGMSRMATPDALAACHWSEWLGRMGPRPDAGRVGAPADELPDALRLALCGGELTLVDAWFAGSAELHLRLRATRRMASPRLRGYQPDTGVRWVGCGETAVTGAGETIVRLRLRSRFAPLLLVLVDAAGNLVDSTLLAFPSLFRGGAHFGELAAMPGDAGMMVAARERALGLLGKYLAAETEGAPPALSHIAIGLDGANGTEPGLEGDLLDWLIRDLGVTVTTRAAVADDPSATAIGADVAALGGPLAPRIDGGSLELPARAIPTLGALFAQRDEFADGICRAIYLDAGAGQAGYGFDCAQPEALVERLAPAQGELMPRFRGEITCSNSGRERCADAGGTSDLAICWPAVSSTVVQTFFPLGIAGLAGLTEPLMGPRRLSVVVDATEGQVDISALLVSIDALRAGFEFDAVIVCRFPGMPMELPAVPEGLATVLQVVTVSSPGKAQRVAEALQARDVDSGADRVLVLDETVVLHDARVAGMLWSACDADRVGAASCTLVSEVVSGKGVTQVHRTAGWIVMSDPQGTSRFAVTDLAGYALPAVLPVVAPDLRCAMVDTATLITSGNTGDDDLSFGLSLGHGGLTSLCLTFVAATTRTPRSDQAGIEQCGGALPHGVFRIRSFRR